MVYSDALDFFFVFDFEYVCIFAVYRAFLRYQRLHDFFRQRVSKLFAVVLKLGKPYRALEIELAGCALAVEHTAFCAVGEVGHVVPLFVVFG